MARQKQQLPASDCTALRVESNPVLADFSRAEQTFCRLERTRPCPYAGPTICMCSADNSGNEVSVENAGDGTKPHAPSLRFLRESAVE